MKRVLLYLITNLAVLLLLTVVAHLLGLDVTLASRGVDMGSLLLMAAVLGFGGSLISLALSKWTAVHLMGVQVIGEPQEGTEAWLLETVSAHARRCGIGMPEVGIYDSPQMNAFATGARRNAALVAVSTGLLAGMSREEAEAVLGHEITHVANGDMVTLALLQGVLNTFVIFLARALGALIDSTLGGARGERRGRGPLYILIVLVLQLVLGLLASLVVMAFSRGREFRADAGAARLVGTGNMIAALTRLGAEPGATLPGQMAAFGVAGRFATGLQRLFMSHPPLTERIAALQRLDKRLPRSGEGPGHAATSSMG
jgi:heat shock protein HtpX